MFVKPNFDFDKISSAGLDELPIPVKAEFDAYYLENRSFALDFKILWMTVVKVVRREGVVH